ncbi:MAG: dihydrolipoyl dehydrogenase [Pirellulales bacterium]|nr:dihydrolipoyl dehydrogenase [Pirellulales bacterium]
MHVSLVVFGGGPGGYAAAFLAADLGLEVAIVDREPRLGGTCLLKGCIPSKALLHVAKVLSEAREASHWGVTFAQPQIDIDVMRSRKEKVIDTLSGGLKQLAKKRNVRIIHAEAEFLDSQTLKLSGGDPATRDDDKLTFDHCILAVGSSPTRIPAFDLKTNRVMDSTGALELRDVPESLLVIGGGYIGLEMGTVYAELGAKVSVVELTDGLLPGADRDLVKPLAARLEKQFAGIHLQTKVEGLKDGGDHIEATLSASSGTRQEKFSRVLVSVGRRPNSRGIGLENTQVELDQRGFVVVDRQQRTADPHILAIGDVAGEPMLAHKAAHEGKVAVEALHGGPAEFDKVAIPAVVFTDPELAWAGLTEEQARQQGRDVEVARYPWAASGRAQSLLRTEGLTKLIVDPENERVLGVGIVGAGAGELIAEAVLAMEMGCTARDLAESIHPHPTLSETVGFSAEAFLGTATEIYRPRKAGVAD